MFSEIESKFKCSFSYHLVNEFLAIWVYSSPVFISHWKMYYCCRLFDNTTVLRSWKKLF